MVITSHFLTKFLLSVGRVSSLGWLGLGIKENSVQWTGGKFKDKEGLPGRRGWYWFLFRHDAKNKKAKKGVLSLCINNTRYLSVRSKCNKIFFKNILDHESAKSYFHENFSFFSMYYWYLCLLSLLEVMILVVYFTVEQN